MWRSGRAGWTARGRRFISRCTGSSSAAASTGSRARVMGLPFKDTQCGFKAFRRPAAQVIFRLQRIERWGFDPEILFIARKLRYVHPRGAGDAGAMTSAAASAISKTA